MSLLISLCTCFPSCLFSCFVRLFVAVSARFFVLPLQVRPVKESSNLVILLHCCLGQSGTTVVPPGRDQRPIPFILAKDFHTSPSCFPFGPRGWSSLGGLWASTFSSLQSSWFLLLLSPFLSLSASTSLCSVACMSLRVCSRAQGGHLLGGGRFLHFLRLVLCVNE